MSPSILKDENLQGREKTIFTVFSVMKFFEQVKQNDLNHVKTSFSPM